LEKVIGIDLGTTNSCVAIVEDGRPIVIANKGGYITTPSMVAVSDTGKRRVGQIAKRQAVTNAENTVYAAKRLIGRKWGSMEVDNAIANSAYEIVQGPHQDARIVLQGETMSIPQISAIVLQEMKIVAEDHIGQPVKKAVITVPAYFNDNQRQATKDAGEIAGLEVIRIINEPTAAALSYGFGMTDTKTVVVYDFGGGTFDVSILEIAPHGMFRVVATGGDTFLGGEDIDNAIMKWLVKGFKIEHGIDLTNERVAIQRIKDAAEKAKCDLSSTTDVEINLPFIYSPRGSGDDAKHLQRKLSRQMLEELTGDLIERSMSICEQCLTEADLEKDEIDEVILVGGMTRMPKIQEAVKTFFEREPCKGVHPDECVALGAAIQGAALVGGNQEILLLDVTPHALGLMAAGNVFERLIEPNTAVPTEEKKIFTTSRDNQTMVKLVVLQGDSDSAEENELLGEFNLTGLRAAPRGQVQIEVSFSIDADGIVHVRAKDLERGVEQAIQVTATSGLTRDEIDVMFEDAQEDLVERREEEALEKAKQEVQKLVADIELLRAPVEAILTRSDFGRDAVAKTTRLIDDAKSALQESGDEATMKALAERLARALKMFKQTLAAG
jgi:molecular chaperone DnaK